MIVTLAIAAVLMFFVGIGVAVAPAAALERSARSDALKAPRTKAIGKAGTSTPSVAPSDCSGHAALALSRAGLGTPPKRLKLVKHEL
jgi:hypothetical protein